MPKISIISPVYNASEYIDHFLESLENQTFQDFEVVFVYDKSKDDCLEKLEFFCKKEGFKNKTKIIENVEKKGVGYAKDLGMQYSNPFSKYVIFLDSDDSFQETFLAKMICKAEETGSDITCCGYYRINYADNKVICEEMTRNPERTQEISQLSFPLFLINTAAWNKLYTREVAEKCRFGFAQHAEDLFFLLESLSLSKRISFINEPLYRYFIHSGSLINSLSYERYIDTCDKFKLFEQKKNNTDLFSLISAFIFLRIGIGTTIRVCESRDVKPKIVISQTKKYMKQYFLVFKKNKYLSFWFLRKAGVKGLAIWLLRMLYKMSLFYTAVKIYTWRQKKTKKEIRW